MPRRPSRLTKLVRDVFGPAPDERSPHERFRDVALPELPAVTRFALSLTRDESDAGDLVQETFLRALRAWHQFVPGTECRAWLFTICRNTYVRTASRGQRIVATEDAELEALGAAALHASAQAEGLDSLFARVDVIPAVRAAVDGLPDPFREVVVLVDLEQQSYEEAARVLSLPKGTVRSRLFRGRRLLQEKLIAYARDAGLVAHEDPSHASEGGSHE